MNTKQPTAPGEPKVHIPATREHAIGMSNRQFAFLRYLADAKQQTLGLEELSHLSQVTVGSFKRQSRQYIIETPDRRGVQLTHKGREALKQFEHGDFLRTVARMSFSSFLSLDVYEGEGEGDGEPRGKGKGKGKGKTKAKTKAVGRASTAKAAPVPITRGGRAHAA